MNLPIAGRTADTPGDSHWPFDRPFERPEGLELKNLSGAPIAQDLAYNLGAGQPITIDLLASYVPSSLPVDPESVQIESPPTHGTVYRLMDGQLHYIPEAGFDGTETLTYSLADAAGFRSPAATIELTILPARPPWAENMNCHFKTSSQDNLMDVISGATPGDAALAGVDPVEITGTPSHGTATVDAAGSIRYTPTPGYAGPDTVKYRVRDNNGLASLPATVTILVEDDAAQLIVPSGEVGFGGTSDPRYHVNSIAPVMRGTIVSGDYPLGVIVDAIETDYSGKSPFGQKNAFSVLEYSWDFGDPNSQSLLNPATQESEDVNHQHGPLAAFVYKSPGTYHPKLTVRGRRADGTIISAETTQIRVDSTWILRTWNLESKEPNFRIKVDASGGTFTLTIAGRTTTPIAYNANGATVRAAVANALGVLEQFVSIKFSNPSGTKGVEVKLLDAAALRDTQETVFAGPWYRPSQVSVTADGANLTGGAGSATIEWIDHPSDPASGTFTLTYKGQTTAELPLSADPLEIQAALEDLPTIGPGNVECRSQGSKKFENGIRYNAAPILIRFVGALGGTKVATTDFSLNDYITQPTNYATAEGIESDQYGLILYRFDDPTGDDPAGIYDQVAVNDSLPTVHFDPDYAGGGSDGSIAAPYASAGELKTQINNGGKRVLIKAGTSFDLGGIFKLERATLQQVRVGRYGTGDDPIIRDSNIQLNFGRGGGLCFQDICFSNIAFDNRSRGAASFYFRALVDPASNKFGKVSCRNFVIDSCSFRLGFRGAKAIDWKEDGTSESTLVWNGVALNPDVDQKSVGVLNFTGHRFAIVGAHLQAGADGNGSNHKSSDTFDHYVYSKSNDQLLLSHILFDSENTANINNCAKLMTDMNVSGVDGRGFLVRDSLMLGGVKGVSVSQSSDLGGNVPSAGMTTSMLVLGCDLAIDDGTGLNSYGAGKITIRDSRMRGMSRLAWFKWSNSAFDLEAASLGVEFAQYKNSYCAGRSFENYDITFERNVLVANENGSNLFFFTPEDDYNGTFEELELRGSCRMLVRENTFVVGPGVSDPFLFKIDLSTSAPSVIQFVGNSWYLANGSQPIARDSTSSADLDHAAWQGLGYDDGGAMLSAPPSTEPMMWQSTTPAPSADLVPEDAQAFGGFPRLLDVLGNETAPDLDPSTLTVVVAPVHGVAQVLPQGTIQYTANSGYVGPDAITYEVHDLSGTTSRATVSIEVLPTPQSSGGGSGLIYG